MRIENNIIWEEEEFRTKPSGNPPSWILGPRTSSLPVNSWVILESPPQEKSLSFSRVALLKKQLTGHPPGQPRHFQGSTE